MTPTRLRPGRNLAVLALTVVAASTDAISYLALGRVFPANMTGNTVLMGVGLADADYGAATRSAVALAAFVGGAGLFGLVLGALDLGEHGDRLPAATRSPTAATGVVGTAAGRQVAVVVCYFASALLAGFLWLHA